MSIKVMTCVWEESTAKGSTLLLLLALADIANDEGFGWPSIATLARRTRLTTTTVRTQLKNLESKGHIGREQRPGSSTMYRVLTPPKTFTPPKNPPLPIHDGYPSQSTMGTPSAVLEGTPPAAMETNRKEPSIEPSVEPSTRVRDRFDEFWEIYPIKSGKKPARDAWVRALKKVDAQVIIDGGRRYRDDPNRVDQWTKYPQGWLNDERWNDGPLAPRVGERPSPTTRAADTIEMGRRLQEQADRRAISA